MLLLPLLAACSEYEVNEKAPEPEPGGGDTAPLPEEVCNGADDDGDGYVDEGSADGDGDGRPDCVDNEDCDGEDNDGDGLADEDFPDTDADGTADCLDVEECDGVDNDGDGAADEGFDADGDTIVDCAEQLHTVTVMIAADDGWEAWLDGVAAASGGGWNVTSTYTFTLDSGPHVLAVRAYDSGAAIAGFLAAVQVDGSWVSLSGDGTWKVYDGVPSDAWQAVGYDDSGWGQGAACDAGDVARYWGGEPADLRATGATWIWPRPCTWLGEATFRLEATLQ